MATAAERQAAYRQRRPTAGENGERRINTWVTTGAALALARLAQHYGVTQRDMLERLIIAADVCRSLHLFHRYAVTDLPYLGVMRSAVEPL